MPNTIPKAISESKTVKLLRTVFVDNKHPKTLNSRLLGLSRSFEDDQKTIVCLVLFIVLVWYKSWLVDVGLVGLPILSAILLGLSFWFCRKDHLRLSKPIMFIAIFFGVSLISALSASQSQLTTSLLMNGLFLYFQLGLAYVVGSTIKNKKLLVNSLLIISVPLILVGLYQGLWGPDTSKMWTSGAETLIRRRAFATLGSPNVFGGVIIINILLSVVCLLNNHRQKKIKWWLVVYQMASLVALVLTFSRSAWLAMFGGFLVIIIGLCRRWLKFMPLAVLVLLVPSIRQRLLVVLSFEYRLDSSLDGRHWSFNTAMEVFKKSPLLGTGPGSYGGQTALYHNSPVYLQGLQNGYTPLFYTDNQWVQVLVQTGLFGILALIGFFVAVAVNNIRRYIQKRNYYSLGAVAILVAIIIFGSFANVLEFGAIIWPAGVGLGLGEIND